MKAEPQYQRTVDAMVNSMDRLRVTVNSVARVDTMSRMPDEMRQSIFESVLAEVINTVSVAVAAVAELEGRVAYHADRLDVLEFEAEEPEEVAEEVSDEAFEDKGPYVSDDQPDTLGEDQ